MQYDEYYFLTNSRTPDDDISSTAPRWSSFTVLFRFFVHRLLVSLSAGLQLRLLACF